MLLDAGIHVGEGADRAGDGADGDLFAGADQSFAGALELGVVAGQLDPEGGGFGVDAVAAAHGRRQPVFQGAPLQRGQHQIDILDQEIGGLRQLHAEAGVEHVRRGHALVQEARLRTDDLGHVGEEGDDVVLGDPLDLVDPVGVPEHVLALFPDGLGGQLGNGPERGHGVGGMGLDLEHDAEFGLGRPDGGGFGAGITGDHGR